MIIRELYEQCVDFIEFEQKFIICGVYTGAKRIVFNNIGDDTKWYSQSQIHCVEGFDALGNINSALIKLLPQYVSEKTVFSIINGDIILKQIIRRTGFLSSSSIRSLIKVNRIDIVKWAIDEKILVDTDYIIPSLVEGRESIPEWATKYKHSIKAYYLILQTKDLKSAKKFYSRLQELMGPEIISYVMPESNVGHWLRGQKEKSMER